jgi:hypothetical protein
MQDITPEISSTALKMEQVSSSETSATDVIRHCVMFQKTTVFVFSFLCLYCQLMAARG